METFGFIMHPLSIKRDIGKKYPIAKLLPERMLEAMIKRLGPKTISHIEGIKSETGAEAEGWFVGCFLAPRQFIELPEEFVISKIADAAKTAQDLGARIVGLGAFTSVAGDAGISVAKAVDIAVTTGNTYTIATALEAANKAASLMGIELSNAHAAVVGAGGSIGRVCAKLLAEQVPELTLVGRDVGKLKLLAEELSGKSEVTCSDQIDVALRNADVVITVTSSLEAVIPPDALKSGSVVCDVARPRDVSALVTKVRPDVLVIEGGVVSVPGDVNFNFNFGFPPKTSYACMAETIILALEGRYESFSLGRDLEVNKVREISALADKHGFSLAGFRCFERAISDKEIENVRFAAEKARKSAAS